jgi:diguanylate cyclase (GGDEF)-like protein
MEAGAGNGHLVVKLQAEVARLKDENQKLRASNRRWMRIAGTDSLTGLPNKVFFSTALLPQAIGQGNADGLPVGGIMISPDNLGEYNKKFGRQAGNEIVKGVASFLSENVDGEEKLVHIDGANFVLIVPDADLAKAKRRALTIRARVLNRQFDCGDASVSLTLSLGVVSRSPSPEGAQVEIKEVVEEFLRRMEAALDQAKQMGGDRPVEDPEVSF